VKSKTEGNPIISGTTAWAATISERIIPTIGNNFIWVLVVIMAIVAGILNPVFWSSQNLLNILNANAYLACMVLGMSLVLISANMDISLESNLLFTAMVGGILMMSPTPHLGFSAGLGWPWPLALVVMLALSSFIGLFNGILTVKLNMNPLIVTIAMMLGLLGGALVLASIFRVGNLPQGFLYMGSAEIGPVSVAVLFVLVMLVIAAVVLKKTTFGAHLYAVGGNRRAARAAGINDGRMIISAFVLCGFLSGVSAFILMGRLGTANAGMSQQAIFLVAAAAMIGGVSMYGGRGGVGGMVGGLLLMGMIANLLTLAGVSSMYVNVVTMILILIALGIDSFRRRRQARE